MGQATMSSQSPQTGGKTGQYGQPGQAGGKGMAGAMMDAIPQKPQMSQSIPQQMPQQADGNKQMGAPLPPMGGPMQQADMQQTNPQQPAGGKGQGMGQGNITYPSQSGQPVMGMPNAYTNTVGQPSGFSEQGSMYKGGKGAGPSNGSGA